MPKQKILKLLYKIERCYDFTLKHNFIVVIYVVVLFAAQGVVSIIFYNSNNIIYYLITTPVLFVFCLSPLFIPNFIIAYKVKNLSPGQLVKNNTECFIFYEGKRYPYWNSYEKLKQNEILLIVEKAIIGSNYNKQYYLSLDLYDDDRTKIKVLYQNNIFWVDPRILEII